MKTVEPWNRGTGNDSLHVEGSIEMDDVSARATRIRQEVRIGASVVVHARLAGKRGRTCGESHVACRYADEVVEHVLALHAGGTPARQIARQCGIHRATVCSWIRGTRRRPPQRRSITRRPLDFTLNRLIGLADLPIPKPSPKPRTP